MQAWPGQSGFSNVCFATCPRCAGSGQVTGEAPAVAVSRQRSPLGLYLGFVVLVWFGLVYF